MHLFDIQIDFFLPLWRRVATVAVCLGWSAFEFAYMTPLWGIVFGAMGIYAVWKFFLDGWPAQPDRPVQTGQSKRQKPGDGAD